MKKANKSQEIIPLILVHQLFGLSDLDRGNVKYYPDNQSARLSQKASFLELKAMGVQNPIDITPVCSDGRFAVYL
jgi:hypothetical protein